MSEKLTLSPKGFGAFSNVQNSEFIRSDGVLYRRREDGFYEPVAETADEK